MWRDIERRAKGYGFEARVPVPYPLKEFDLANRVAILGMQEGWCPNYVRETYLRWFLDGLEPGSEPNVSYSLTEIGQNPTKVLEASTGENTRAAYEKQTEEAKAKGNFGSPSFIVDGELFWGDDRLEDAVSWALG